MPPRVTVRSCLHELSCAVFGELGAATALLTSGMVLADVLRCRRAMTPPQGSLHSLTGGRSRPV